ncbi:MULTISPECIES: ABC transporter permease [unclassified Beijerinckia]|uniref:ABC transporter permease n=1 Tax=unclassified Beijerinckia TaxID=2638183 RepID=UPI00089AC9AC|nr:MULTISPECIES: ABC transporter permease [unclassified Beijerinckia]MDH7798963.1 ABC-type nitrate/sulfonate/bicarbonate transport system permease component [Beijerinckia sp. GAS462]SED85783.1 NitT/TauT family transport system permease protein/sulfonate transport system permease protein [Beijerinckia sp. 28-YEA-48]
MQLDSTILRSGNSVTSRLVQFTFVFGVWLFWYASARFGWISPLALPAPDAVWREFIELLSTGAFAKDLFVTMLEVAIAFAISTCAGLGLGYLIATSNWRVRVFEPLLSSLNSIPAVMFVPLFILLFGLGITSKIVMGVATGFFPIILSTIAGISNIDPTYFKVARSMGATRKQIFRCVILPGALPVILTGLRMGFIVAFLSILGAEAIGSYAGLGHRIVESVEMLAMPRMYAFIAFAVLIAAALNVLLQFAERKGQWE